MLWEGRRRWGVLMDETYLCGQGALFLGWTTSVGRVIGGLEWW